VRRSSVLRTVTALRAVEPQRPHLPGAPLALLAGKMQVEVRSIITDAVDPRPGFISKWLEASRGLRGAPLDLPARGPGREVAL